MFYVDDYVSLYRYLDTRQFCSYLKKSSFQVIAGIVFPPSILLLGFRVGDDTYQGSDGNTGAKDKDDDNKSSRVTRVLSKTP